MKKIALLILVSTVFFCKSFTLLAEAIKAPEFLYDCKADREAIATLEFLKSHAEFGLSLDQMRSISVKVSGGCTGAAEAFISITEMLLKSKLDGRNALVKAESLASAGVLRAKSFERIFKRAFAKEYLDLDIQSAMNMALSLSSEYKGDPEIAAKDFQRLSEFCVKDVGIGLSRGQCANMVQRVLISNSESGTPIADSFCKFFKFLTNTDLINLTAGDALKIAEQLASKSAESFGAFKNSFEYAQSETGLKLSRADAVRYATEIASNVKQPRDKLQRN